MRKLHSLGTGDLLIFVSLHDAREVGRAGGKRPPEFSAAPFGGCDAFRLTLADIVPLVFRDEGK